MADDAVDVEDGLSVVLSPVQLAAVLQGVSISTPETRSNRLWGVVTLIGGGIELVGSAALLLTPEPTMITKAGGIALGIHGSDTAATGMRQIWTGERGITMTQAAVSAAARNLGADTATAEKAGVAVDILVPIVVTGVVAAARALAVRSGRLSLAVEEAAGGHTIARHIGKTEAELRARPYGASRHSCGIVVPDDCGSRAGRQRRATSQRSYDPELGATGGGRAESSNTVCRRAADRLRRCPKHQSFAADDQGPDCAEKNQCCKQSLLRPDLLSGALMMGMMVEQPVNPYLEQFPYLDYLLGAWFHQDFDLEGDVQQIIPKFVAVTRPEEVWAAIADIRRFIAYRHNDSEDAFQRLFPGAVLPSGWNMTAIEWLQWVDQLLVSALESLHERTARP